MPTLISMDDEVDNAVKRMNELDSIVKRISFHTDLFNVNAKKRFLKVRISSCVSVNAYSVYNLLCISYVGINAGTNFIRAKLREDGFFRKVVSNDQL